MMLFMPHLILPDYPKKPAPTQDAQPLSRLSSMQKGPVPFGEPGLFVFPGRRVEDSCMGHPPGQPVRLVGFLRFFGTGLNVIKTPGMIVPVPWAGWMLRDDFNLVPESVTKARDLAVTA